jgi:Bacteriophage Lambda NinG protein
MLSRRSFLSRSPFVARPPATGSRRWLIAELDTYMALIVRRRDRRCVTCGARQGLQCSHFYSRRYLATRFDLRNCNLMCVGCNRRHNEDPAPYLQFMLARYGAEVVAALDELRRSMHKVSDEELGELLKRYRAEL